MMVGCEASWSRRSACVHVSHQVYKHGSVVRWCEPLTLLDKLLFSHTFRLTGLPACVGLSHDTLGHSLHSSSCFAVDTGTNPSPKLVLWGLMQYFYGSTSWLWKKKHCNWRVTVCNTGIHSVSGSTFKRFLPWSCTWHVVQSLGIALEVQALHSFRLYCKICECSCDRFLSRALNLMPRVKLLSHHFFTQIPTLRLRLIGATLQIMDSNLKDPTAQTVVQSVM